jgi:hypothetical protein
MTADHEHPKFCRRSAAEAQKKALRGERRSRVRHRQICPSRPSSFFRKHFPFNRCSLVTADHEHPNFVARAQRRHKKSPARGTAQPCSAVQICPSRPIAVPSLIHSSLMSKHSCLTLFRRNFAYKVSRGASVVTIWSAIP